MRIIIETIPHSKQRYNTIGDWYASKTNGDVHINISSLRDWRYEFLIAIHELCEAFYCLYSGVTEEHVDKFDKAHVGDDEPGDSPDSPYQRQHCLATGVERILASCLGVKWAEYEDRIEEVSGTYPTTEPKV